MADSTQKRSSTSTNEQYANIDQEREEIDLDQEWAVREILNVRRKKNGTRELYVDWENHPVTGNPFPREWISEDQENEALTAEADEFEEEQERKKAEKKQKQKQKGQRKRKQDQAALASPPRPKRGAPVAESSTPSVATRASTCTPRNRTRSQTIAPPKRSQPSPEVRIRRPTRFNPDEYDRFTKRTAAKRVEQVESSQSSRPSSHARRYRASGFVVDTDDEDEDDEAVINGSGSYISTQEGAVDTSTQQQSLSSNPELIESTLSESDSTLSDPPSPISIPETEPETSLIDIEDFQEQSQVQSQAAQELDSREIPDTFDTDTIVSTSQPAAEDAQTVEEDPDTTEGASQAVVAEKSNESETLLDSSAGSTVQREAEQGAENYPVEQSALLEQEHLESTSASRQDFTSSSQRSFVAQQSLVSHPPGIVHSFVQVLDSQIPSQLQDAQAVTEQVNLDQDLISQRSPPLQVSVSAGAAEARSQEHTDITTTRPTSPHHIEQAQNFIYDLTASSNNNSGNTESQKSSSTILTEQNAQVVPSPPQSTGSQEDLTGSIYPTVEKDEIEEDRATRFDSSQKSPERPVLTPGCSPVQQPPVESLDSLNSSAPARLHTPSNMDNSTVDLSNPEELEKLIAQREREDPYTPSPRVLKKSKLFPRTGTRSPSTIPAERSPVPHVATSLRTVAITNSIPVEAEVSTHSTPHVAYNVTTLQEPNAQEATMQEATMQEATMQEATMQEATMQEATMQEATMQEATMQEATMQEATMQEATMQEATMQDDTMQQDTMQQGDDISSRPASLIPSVSGSGSGKDDLSNTAGSDIASLFNDDILLEHQEYIVPLPIGGRQANSYVSELELEENTTTIDAFLLEGFPQLSEVERIVQRLRAIETHVDLIYGDPLSDSQARSFCEAQVQWSDANSIKFRFIGTLLRKLQDRDMHVVLVIEDQLFNLVETFLMGKFVNFKSPTRGRQADMSQVEGNLRVTVLTVDASPLLQPPDLIICLDRQVKAVQIRKKNWSVNPDKSIVVPILHLVIPRTVDHIERNTSISLDPRRQLHTILMTIRQIQADKKIGHAIIEPTPKTNEAANDVVTFLTALDEDLAPQWPLPSIGSIKEIVEYQSQSQSQSLDQVLSPRETAVKRPLEDEGFDSAKRMRFTPQPPGLGANDVTHISDSMPGTAVQLQEQLAEIKRQRDQERAQFNAERERWEKQQTVHEDLSRTYSTLRAEKEILESRVEALTKKETILRERMDAKATEHQELQSRFEVLQSANLISDDDKVREITQLRKDLEAERDAKKRAIKSQKIDNENLEYTKERYRETQETAANLTAENEELRKELAIAKNKASGKINDLAKSFHDRQAKLASQKEDQNALQNKILTNKLAHQEAVNQRLKASRGVGAGTRAQSVGTGVRTRPSSRATSPLRDRVTNLRNG